jgi:hypothetical protein
VPSSLSDGAETVPAALEVAFEAGVAAWVNAAKVAKVLARRRRVVFIRKSCELGGSSGGAE